MGEFYGYCRCSGTNQNVRYQVERMEQAGIPLDNVVTEFASGKKARPKLEALFARMQPGDTLVVTRLDRLGRSAIDLGRKGARIDEMGCHLRVLDQNVDTTVPMGRLIFHVLAAMAQFEREMIYERTQDGLASARARGVQIGRPGILSPVEIRAAAGMRDANEPVTAIAAKMNVSESTLRRALKHYDETQDFQRSVNAKIRNAGRKKDEGNDGNEE